MRRPSASVFPISTVMPARLCSTSSGRKAFPETLFSTAGTKMRSRTGRPAIMIIRARPSVVAAPPISFFISFIPVGGFRSRPPLSKQTPLPTIVTFGSLGLPHRISISRGARSDARPTACTIG